MKIVDLNRETKADLLGKLLKRKPDSFPEQEKQVAAIIDDVRNRGDEAIFEYAEKFDHCKLTAETFRVTDEEVAEAVRTVGEDLMGVMGRSINNIRSFHECQKRQSFFNTKENGVILGQRISPIERAGVYVPGGKAVYPSSVLMNVVPALVAGVKEIIMTTPANSEGKVNPQVLAACKLLGIRDIFKTGGAQAIAAMAYGTQSIKKVDKIVGPGNIYVALAKRAVYGHVSIDSIAGPSEILVLADDSANPKFIAADLLSQAEHDEMASAILVTTCSQLAEKVSEEIDRFLTVLSRRDIIEKSLENYGYALVAKNITDALDAVNDIASEHLEIVTRDPWKTMTMVKNAGAIFLGPYSSEPLGDYFAGPNHVLPTNCTAKFFSPLSVDDFIKKTSIISYSEPALRSIHEDIDAFARAEKLTAHANSIAVRFQ